MWRSITIHDRRDDSHNIVNDLDHLLPSAGTIRRALDIDMEGWSRHKAPPSLWEEEEEEEEEEERDGEGERGRERIMTVTTSSN